MPVRVKRPVCFRHFVRRADVHAAADARVLALGVLAHADHVDVGRRAVRERRGQAGQQPHRPQVHVLLEALPERQQQIPHGDVIGNCRRSDRAEIDGVERRGRSKPSSSIIRPCLEVVVAAPGQLGELDGDAGARDRGFDGRKPGGDDFFADAVAGDDRDLVGACAVMKSLRGNEEHMRIHSAFTSPTSHDSRVPTASFFALAISAPRRLGRKSQSAEHMA